MSNAIPGEYSTIFSPRAFESNSPVTFYVEFYKAGYVNTTYEQGTSTQFTIVVNTGLPAETQIITIGIVLAIIIFITWLLYSKGYKQRYVQPKQQQHEKIENCLQIDTPCYWPVIVKVQVRRDKEKLYIVWNNV